MGRLIQHDAASAHQPARKVTFHYYRAPYPPSCRPTRVPAAQYVGRHATLSPPLLHLSSPSTTRPATYCTYPPTHRDALAHRPPLAPSPHAHPRPHPHHPPTWASGIGLYGSTPHPGKPSKKKNAPFLCPLTHIIMPPFMPSAPFCVHKTLPLPPKKNRRVSANGRIRALSSGDPSRGLVVGCAPYAVVLGGIQDPLFPSA